VRQQQTVTTAPRLVRQALSWGDAAGLHRRGWEWRGPAPYYFVTVPAPESVALQDISPEVTYGWGMIPVEVEIGTTTFTTSLWPKDGGYVVPLKAKARRAEGIDLGDVVRVRLTVDG
jgi:uncharacterized protein DUF1905